MNFTLRMKKYFVTDWLGKVLVAHWVLPLSVLSLSMTHEEGRAVSALVSICWVFLVFLSLYQTIIHLSKWGWGDTLGLRARLPISLTNFHINHLSLGRTGLLTFHKLAHTTCSETRWRWRWRWQTGCRQVDRLCSPINPAPHFPSLPPGLHSSRTCRRFRCSLFLWLCCCLVGYLTHADFQIGPKMCPATEQEAEVDHQLHYTVRNFRCQ